MKTTDRVYEFFEVDERNYFEERMLNYFKKLRIFYSLNLDNFKEVYIQPNTCPYVL